MSQILTFYSEKLYWDSILMKPSNDGTLLEQFTRHGVRRLGVNPAQNLAPLARVVTDDINAESPLTGSRFDRDLIGLGRPHLPTA